MAAALSFSLFYGANNVAVIFVVASLGGEDRGFCFSVVIAPNIRTKGTNHFRGLRLRLREPDCSGIDRERVGARHAGRANLRFSYRLLWWRRCQSSVQPLVGCQADVARRERPIAFCSECHDGFAQAGLIFGLSLRYDFAPHIDEFGDVVVGRR